MQNNAAGSKAVCVGVTKRYKQSSLHVVLFSRVYVASRGLIMVATSLLYSNVPQQSMHIKPYLREDSSSLCRKPDSYCM